MELLFAVVGSFIGLLLAVIALFLKRLLAQFDALTQQVGKLGETLIRIDSDFNGEIALLAERDEMMQRHLAEFSPLWDRVRKVEDGLLHLNSIGCPARCGN